MVEMDKPSDLTSNQSINQSVIIEKTVHACSYKFCAHAIISFILQALKNK